MGNSLVTSDFSSQRPVTWRFDIFFDLRLNKQLSKQSRWWWLQMPSCLLWCHCNAMEAPDKKIIPCTGIDHQIIVVSTGRWGMGMWQESSRIGTRQSAVLHLMNNIFSPDWMGQTYQGSALTYSPDFTTNLLMLAILSHSRHTNLMHNILHAILYHDFCIWLMAVYLLSMYICASQCTSIYGY